MKKTPIIIDTDPGVDDTIAIIMVAGNENYSIKALTSTHGNVGLEGTSKNALNLSDFLNIGCDVAKGAAKPMIVPLKNASDVHGANGMGGFELPESKKEFAKEAAWDYIYNQAVIEQGELVLLVLGPMTNIAIAILKYPEITKLIKRIYMMGGSRSFGNHSQNAEFNIWGDPHACEIVLQSGIPITMADLIFGMEHYFTGKQVKQAYANAKKLKPMLDAFWKHDLKWIEKDEIKKNIKIDPDDFEFAIFDATAAGAMLLSDKLVCENYYVVCETQGTQTQGQTVFDYKNHKGKKANVQLAVKMPMDDYYKLFADAIAFFE